MSTEPEHDALRERLGALLEEYRDQFEDAAAAMLRADLSDLLARGPARSASAKQAAASDRAAKDTASKDAVVRDRAGGEPAEASAAPREERGPARGRVAELQKLFPDIVGESPKMLEMFELILKVAPTDTTVFLHGESGTGKELAARAIHDHSRRADKPYVAENCAAFTETLLESELFGHTRGSFTGADRNRIGRFKAADKGTLFLDEVGDMSPGLQKKLLRALQDGEIRPVGAQKSMRVDVRVISASNKDLWKLVQEGRFREDLYYRLCPIRIDLPPLRERGADVLLLVDRLSSVFAARMGRAGAVEFRPAARQALRRYRWPGNVRELQNELQRTLALSTPGEPIDVADLSPEVRAEGGR